MKKSKRSFFERLTGAVRIDDDVAYDLEQENPREESVASQQQPEHPHEHATEHQQHPVEEKDTIDGQLAIDVHQTPTTIVVKTMVAGVRPDDLDIAITRDMVTIKGKREMDRTIQEDNFYHRELYWGTFSRTILLPEEVDVEEAEAIERHGLLIITLPKINKNKQTKLKVKAN